MGIDYLSKFNQTFKEFVNDLISLFPEDDDLQLYKTGIIASMMINDEFIVSGFEKYVVMPYGAKILQKDESFFVNHDYMDIPGGHKAMDFIQKIKGYWTNMSPENKEIVWKYFKVLVLLSNKIKI